MNSTDELIIQALLVENRTVFGPFFSAAGLIANVDPGTKAEAEKIFLDKYPTAGSFEELVSRWHNSNRIPDLNTEFEGEILLPNDGESSRICGRLAFDPSQRRNVSVVAPARKRLRKDEFDAYEFLSKRISGQAGIPIRFQSDMDLEDDLDVLHSEQKGKLDLTADIALRKIARAATVLNEACNYKIIGVR